MFDFDGTIANTIPVGLKVVNSLAEEFGFPVITEAEFLILRDKSAKEIMERYKMPLYKIPFIALQVQKGMKERMEEVEVIEGLPAVLSHLEKKGYRLAILTSNSEEVVKQFLQEKNLSMFEFIHAEKNIFGKHHAFRKVIQRYNFTPSEILYLGDEVRDIEACKKVDIDICSVTWGFNSRSFLETYNPEVIIDKPEELLGLV